MGGIVGGSAEFPATSECRTITYLNTQNGSSAPSLIWLKHSQVNAIHHIEFLQSSIKVMCMLCVVRWDHKISILRHA